MFKEEWGLTPENLGESRESKEKELSPEEITLMLGQYYSMLEEMKGEEGAEAVMEKVRGGSSSEAVKTAEKTPDLRQAKERAFEVLGMERNKNGDLVFENEEDLIKNFDKKLEELGKIYKNKHLGDRDILKTIFKLFEGEKAISEKDAEEGEEAKDLLYSPQTAEEALDAENIKNADFYLSPYDFFQHPNSITSRQLKYKDKNGDLKKYGYSKNLSSLNIKEVLLPLVLYHPKYADAKREENGKLFIKKESGEYSPFNPFDFRKKWGIFGNHKEKGAGLTDPLLFLDKQIPQVKESGLLREEDFQTRVDRRGSQSINRPMRNIKEKGGALFINNMNHYLGRKIRKSDDEYEKIDSYENYKGCQLDDKHGALLHSNTNELKAIFNIYKKSEEFSSTPQGSSTKHYQVRTGYTDLREYDKTEMFPRRENETEENYKKRIEQILDIPEFLKLAKEIAGETDINMLDYNFEDQMGLVLIYKRDKDRFVDFINRFQADGADACLKVDAPEQAEQLLVKTKTEGAGEDYSYRSIFRKFNNLLQDVGKVEEEVKNNFPDREDIEKIISGYRKQAKDLLFEKLDEVSSDNVDEIVSSLDRINESILVLSVYLQTSKEEGKGVDLEKIRDLDADKKEVGQEFSDKEYEDEKIKKEILDLARENWEENCEKYGIKPEFKEHILNELKENLEHVRDQECHILKYKGNIIGFLRFEDMGDNEVYAGSLNVREEVKGFDVGRAMVELIKNKAEEKVVNATASPKIDAIDYYMKIGFEGVGYKDKEEHGGEPGIMMRMDLGEKKEKAKSAEELKEEYKDMFAKDVLDLKEEEKVGRKYSLPEDMAFYEQELEHLLSRGYKLVNYRREGSGREKDCYLEFVKQEEAREQKQAA